jgi:hypothetical protein
MNTEQVNRWLSLVANIGVIMGLALLAYEVNQSTKVAISAVSQGLTEQSLDFFSLKIDSDTVAKATYKRRLGEELDDYEKYQLAQHQYYNFRVFENAFLQYRRGLYDDSEWEKYQRIIAIIFRTNPIARDMWDRTENEWTVEFLAEVNAVRRSASATPSD